MAGVKVEGAEVAYKLRSARSSSLPSIPSFPLSVLLGPLTVVQGFCPAQARSRAIKLDSKRSYPQNLARRPLRSKMPSSAPQTAVWVRGYCFQLPPLGLPDPAGEWVPVRAAMGAQAACTPLLLDCCVEAPMRSSPDAQYDLFEIEYEDAIWFLPLLPFPSSPDTEPDVFTIYIWRCPVTVATTSSRPRLPFPVRVMFVSPSAPRLECSPEYIGSADPSCMANSKLFRICVDPTIAESQPTEGERVKWRINGEVDKAWEAWSAMGRGASNEVWMRQVHNDAVAAGLRKSTIFDAAKPIFRLRISPEYDGDVRGFDYALCREGDHSASRPEDWLPAPQHAFSPDFVRCGVNLLRLELGGRLFTKKEWPPRPTTLMTLKWGGQG